MTPEDAWRLLENSRNRIDDIDVSLVDLLNRRAGVVEDVAAAKLVLNKEVDDPGRREKVLACWADNTRHGQCCFPCACSPPATGT